MNQKQPSDLSGAELDRQVCLCFGVTQRKLINFMRIEKPQVAGQLSECGGAGTGCGWCRPWLKQLFLEYRSDAPSSSESMEVERPRLELPGETEYARRRAAYRQRQESE